MFWNQAIWRIADQVHDGRHPQSDHGDAPVLHAGCVGPVEEGIDVEDPGGDDGGIARPGLDPVAPPDQVAGEVAELVSRVGVEPTVAVGHPLGELSEQQRQEHGADRDDTEDDDAHGAGPGQHRWHGEDAGADDAADDQSRGRSEA